MDFTCVEIKNVKYIKLLSLDKKGEKSLDLTTIHKGQQLADLNIYIIDKNKGKKLLKSIRVNEVRPGSSGIPELKLFVEYDGKRYYKIVLRLNGYICHNSIIDIKQMRTSPLKITNLVIIALAVVIISFLTFFTITTLSRDSIPSVSIGSRSSDRKTDKTGAGETITSQTAAEQTTAEQTTAEQTTAEQTTAEQTTVKPVLIDEKIIVYFNPNRSVITNDAKVILEKALEILKNNENLEVDIGGHCAFYGTEKGRREISSERAENVYSYFVERGWLPGNQPELAGFGHDLLVTRDPDKQNLNRRVEITIKTGL